MNVNMLKSKMALFGDTIKSLAEALDLSTSRMSAKIHSWRDAEFTATEINQIIRRYDLAAYEIEQIFFGEKVSNLDTNETEVNPND